MKRQQYPDGWDEPRIRKVLDHYESQSKDEAVSEDVASYESTTHTMMSVPVGFVARIRELIAKRLAG